MLGKNTVMRKFVFIILVVAFSSIYYFSAVENENSLAFKAKTQFKKLVPASLSNKEPEAAAVVPKKETSEATAVPNGGLVDLGKLNETELKKWVSEQSKAMDSTQNNTPDIEIKIRAMAQSLRKDQLEALSTLVLNVSLPINDRVFSNYLISLNQTPEAAAAAGKIAGTGIPDFGPPNPHSDSELKRSQELAIRYMQIDALADRAKTDSNARDNLKLWATGAESEEVRRYAARKIKDLSL